MFLIGVPFVKGSHYGCLSWLGAQESAIALFNPLAVKRYELCRQGFSSLVFQAVAGTTEASMTRVYQ